MDDTIVKPVALSHFTTYRVGTRPGGAFRLLEFLSNLAALVQKSTLNCIFTSLSGFLTSLTAGNCLVTLLVMVSWAQRSTDDCGKYTFTRRSLQASQARAERPTVLEVPSVIQERFSFGNDSLPAN